MDAVLLGQFLLGFLVVVAILVNLQLARLGRRHRQRGTLLAPFIALLLRWLPLLAVVLVAGGVALGETSLLGYHNAQDVNGLGWFVVGACLSIFADLCAAMAWITLREALKVTAATDDLMEALSVLASQDIAHMAEPDEPS